MKKPKELVLREKARQGHGFKLKYEELQKKMNAEKDFSKKEILKLRMEIQFLKYQQKVKECHLIQRRGY